MRQTLILGRGRGLKDAYEESEDDENAMMTHVHLLGKSEWEPA
jgi:hypothetical protein